MKARWKIGLLIVGLIIMLWVMITDEARMEHEARLKDIEQSISDIESEVFN